MRPFSLSFLLLSYLIIAYADTDTIRKACEATIYYDICVSSLESHPASSTADERGLAGIMLEVGAANATATVTFISSRIRRVFNDTLLRKTLKDCADKYIFARDALRAAKVDLNTEVFDYAYMHAMAAGDYPKACRNAFQRVPGLLYTGEMVFREESLGKICAVVMEMIDNLIVQVKQ